MVRLQYWNFHQQAGDSVINIDNSNQSFIIGDSIS